MWFEQVLHRGQQRRPDHICLRDARRDITWKQFGTEARALATVIEDMSLPGDRVLILSGNRVEFVTAYFACALAGVVAAPVNPALADSELLYVTDATSPAVAIADVAGRERLATLGCAIRSVPIETLSELAVSPTTALRSSGASDPVVMFQTSATTGRPKGVLIDQRYLQLQALSWIAGTEAGPGCVYLNAAALFHGSILLAFDYLAALGVVAILDAFTPRSLIDAVRRWDVTCTMLVPAMTTLLLQDSRTAALKGSSLESVISAGAPLPASLARRLFDVIGIMPRVIFGISEAGVVLHKSAEDDRTQAGHDGGACAGRALPGFAVRIVDDNSGEAMATNEIGMIQFHSYALMQGYWSNPAATEMAIRDGWLTTGDLGYEDPEGFVWVVDRRLDMILRGGQNVYPAEIERVLRQSPQISEVVVVAAPSEIWGQTPVAFIEGNVASVDTSLLLDLCTRELASFKRPSRFFVVDALPRNAIGKVLRSELRLRAASTELTEHA